MLTTRHRIAALGVSVTALALLASPAGAALPKSTPTETKPCPNNPKLKAKVWVDAQNFAAKNPCSSWLVIQHAGESQSDSNLRYVYVARDSKFNRSRNMSSQRWSWGFNPDPTFCESDSWPPVVYFGNGHEWDVTGGNSELRCQD